MSRLLAVPALLTLALAGCTEISSSNPITPAQPVTITIQADKPGAPINKAMWGIFFEDINFGADGGLYAELVKNRAFEFPESMMGWSKIIPSNAKGDISIQTDAPYKPNAPHYLRIASTANPSMGITNEGFRGMGLKAGDAYDFSAQIRLRSGTPRVYIELVGGDGTTLASQNLTGLSNNWTKVSTTLRPKATDPKSRLTLIVEGNGTIDVDNVSLFPENTWKNRPGGLRADMVQTLADLKPGFLRFPGGCIVEGSDLSKRYQWKNTIGPAEDRPLLINRWNYEFKHRPTPDYFQTFGLGFFEYFQLAEDIGAEPLPIVNCGMACQFNSAELVPIDQLEPYIQDMFDLIEFANGPVTSTWGKKRADMGHPEPFNMKMIGVGNEQWGPQYIERLDIFTRRLKEKYPDIKIVSGAGPSPEDERFQFLWPQLQQRKADIVDQHCYANPIWFYANADRYDNYDRNGPKIFFGEYAVQTDFIVSTKNRNNFEAALAEAACMTGLERNADVVHMASYAPLFSNVEAWQWTPDLIWADSLRVVPSANYYVQQLFSTNRGDVVIPTTHNAAVRDVAPAGRIGIGTANASAEFKDVRLTTNSGTVLLDAPLDTNKALFTAGPSWSIESGALRQADSRGNQTAFAGAKDWTNYALTFKARKLAGDDGLVISVCDDGAGTWARWYLGRKGNTEHALVTHYAEQDQFLSTAKGNLETNRWYDIKITVQGNLMECYLDGAKIQSAEILKRRIPNLFASTTKDNTTGELIVKVVNPLSQPTPATINLAGIKNVRSTAKLTLLSAKPQDENTLDKPDNVKLQITTLNGISPNFTYTFKPQSVTMFRIQQNP